MQFVQQTVPMPHVVFCLQNSFEFSLSNSLFLFIIFGSSFSLSSFHSFCTTSTMGCGNSKLNPEGDLLPPRIRPLLHRTKFMEFRKRKNGINDLRDGTLSKKVLLKDGELEEENSLTKSVSSSPNDSLNSLASRQHSKQDKDEDSAIPLSNNNNAVKDATQSNLPLEEEEPLPHLQLNATSTHPDEPKHNKQVKTMEQHKCIEQGDEDKKPEEEARLDNEDNQRLICPGSPSFRVYFVEETNNDKENEMTDAGMENVSHKKSPSHESVECAISAKFGEGQENKTIKKGKKGTSCGKKKPVKVGVKNLLNVKSCYHLSCSGHDRASLLARKAEA